MLPLCKFYRYLIYRLYHFSCDTPVLNVILTLAMVHFFLLIDLLVILSSFPYLKGCLVVPFFNLKNRLLVIIPFFIAHYFLFYNKKKWNAINVEFRDESPRHKKIGLILVWSYLLMPEVLMVVVAMLK